MKLYLDNNIIIKENISSLSNRTVNSDLQGIKEIVRKNYDYIKWFYKAVIGRRFKEFPNLFTPIPTMLEVKEQIGYNYISDLGFLGAGCNVAIIDSGINNHRELKGKILKNINILHPLRRNAKDENGHGSHIAGIICGSSVGIAPESKLLNIKIYDESQVSTTRFLVKALQEIIKVKEALKISVVSLSLGDQNSHKNLSNLQPKEINEVLYLIKELKESKIITVASAGNYFNKNSCNTGMVFPAIIPEVISVGSVYDKTGLPSKKYKHGEEVYKTIKDNLTPYTNRLPKKQGVFHTTIFAPGSIVKSISHTNKDKYVEMEGTSMAAPVVVGAILCLQSAYKKKFNKLPSFKTIKNLIQQNAVKIADLDPNNDFDSVTNSNETYLRLNLKGLLDHI